MVRLGSNYERWPEIASVAALIGDLARANMLTALVGGTLQDGLTAGGWLADTGDGIGLSERR